MSLPRIYADFNSFESLNEDNTLARVGLTGYGSLASLSNQRIRLMEGIALMLYEPNDIEVEGLAHFDQTIIDPAGRIGEWFAYVDPRKIKDSVESKPRFGQHNCFGCGHDLLQHLNAVGRRYNEFCPECGVTVIIPLSPPE
jgi:hypothetical protein